MDLPIDELIEGFRREIATLTQRAILAEAQVRHLTAQQDEPTED